MPLLTIISCKVLQDEIIHILKNDSSVDNILVVDTGEQDYFLEKLHAQNLDYVVLDPEMLAPGTKSYRTDPGMYSVMVFMMELALHEFPRMLRDEVYKRINELSCYSDAILLFYGLCGNVFDKLDDDFSHLETLCPVRILKDDTRTVDDCIGATLGGCGEYLAALKKFSSQGTFLFTPMYAHAWKEIMKIDPDKPEKSIKMMKKVNEITGYARVAKVRTGLDYTENFDEKIKEFAEIFGFEILEIEGKQDIFVSCYEDIKKELFHSR